MKKILPLLLLVLFITSVSGDVDFDDFEIRLVDDEIDVGEHIEVNLVFQDPDNTESVELDIELLINDIPIFRDEDYDVRFKEDEDKTITILSSEFPGPDLDDDYFTDGLLKYACGIYDIIARVSGSDIQSDLESGDELVIGKDDDVLSFEIDPEYPLVDEKITVTVFEKNDREADDMNVEITWIDDPKGEVDGEWDSDDDSWSKETDRDGEIDFKPKHKFSERACGKFQIDIYGEGYCLSRGSFNLNQQRIMLTITPDTIISGREVTICAKLEDGVGISGVSLDLEGAGYANTYHTGVDGCIRQSFTTVGDFFVKASKPCYFIEGDKSFKVVSDQTTTTVTITPTSYTTTTIKKLESTTTTIATSTTLFMDDSSGNINDGVQDSGLSSETPGILEKIDLTLHSVLYKIISKKYGTLFLVGLVSLFIIVTLAYAKISK